MSDTSLQYHVENANIEFPLIKVVHGVRCLTEQPHSFIKKL